MHDCRLPGVQFPEGPRQAGSRERLGWRCPDCGRDWQAVGWEAVDATADSGEARPIEQWVAWAPERGKKPLRLRVWFDRIGGRPSVVGVELWSRKPVTASWPAELDGLPETRIGAGDVHRLRLGELLDAYVVHQRAFGRAVLEHVTRDPDSIAHDPTLPKRAQAIIDEADVNAYGRPRRGAAHYREIARRYRALVREGERSPNKVIAAEHFVADATARSWVRRAGQMGFLPKGSPGAIRDVGEEEELT